jgi:two-component system cell cycle sensor histidine kinase/response regulator CckA
MASELAADLRLDRARAVLALAGGLAHELGNLLAANLTALDLLAANATGEADRRLLAALEESTRQGVHAVRQLLRLARATDGEAAGCELPYLLADLQKLLAFAAPAAVVETAYPPDLWPLAADPLPVYQLLLALAAARRAAGEVRIGARNLPSDAAVAMGLAAGAAGAHAGYVAIEVYAAAGAAGAPEIEREVEPEVERLVRHLGGRAEALPEGGVRIVLAAAPPPARASLADTVAELRRETA